MTPLLLPTSPCRRRRRLQTKKPRYSVVFHRPKTLVRSRDPKFPRVRCGGWAAGCWGLLSCLPALVPRYEAGAGAAAGGDGRAAACVW